MEWKRFETYRSPDPFRHAFSKAMFDKMINNHINEGNDHANDEMHVDVSES